MTKSDLEAKEKEHKNLEEDIVSLKIELEKCKDELKVRIKYEVSANALEKMLNKQKHSKDTKGVGFDVGQCSSSKDSSNNEIHFVSSSNNGGEHTFTVSKITENKTFVAATRNQSRNLHADPKGKYKIDDGGFTKVKDTRRKNSRRPNYAAPRRQMRNNFNNEWYVPQFHD